jgi:hypothetical protein
MVDVGRTHHPEPVVVVAVVRVPVVAVGRARVVLIVVPGATAHHARLGLGPPHRLPGAEEVTESDALSRAVAYRLTRAKRKERSIVHGKNRA